MNKGLRIFSVAVLAAVSTACQTTGDPREGGLFGWSSQKADQRKTSLDAEAADAQNQAAAEQTRSKSTESQRAALQVDVATLQGQYSQLVTENTQLESQLRDLVQQKHLGGRKLRQLREELAQNQQARSSLAAPTAFDNAGVNSLDVLDQQNERLQQEVLFLLSQ